MKNGISSIVSIALLVAFIYAGYKANTWSDMNTWTWHTWTIFFLSNLIAWTARNEFEGK